MNSCIEMTEYTETGINSFYCFFSDLFLLFRAIIQSAVFVSN